MRQTPARVVVPLPTALDRLLDVQCALSNLNAPCRPKTDVGLPKPARGGWKSAVSVSETKP